MIALLLLDHRLDKTAKKIIWYNIRTFDTAVVSDAPIHTA